MTSHVVTQKLQGVCVFSTRHVTYPTLKPLVKFDEWLQQLTRNIYDGT